MAFGPKFDILVSTVSSRSITEQLTARTIFNLYIPAFHVVFFIVSCGFLWKIHSLASLYLQIRLLLYIHFFWLSCSPSCISKSFSIKLVVFPSLHCMCLFCWPFKNMLTTFLQHRSPVIPPKLWQHSSSHNFYLAGRFAVSVSIQQLILQSSREYPYNGYELYSVIYRYIHHGDICDYCFCFFQFHISPCFAVSRCTCAITKDIYISKDSLSVATRLQRRYNLKLSLQKKKKKKNSVSIFLARKS